MVTCVIADHEILDRKKYAEYAVKSSKPMQKYKGWFLVHGGRPDMLEGGWTPDGIIVIAFDGLAHAKEWINFEEYRKPRKIKHSAARVRAITVDGQIPLPRSPTARATV